MAQPDHGPVLACCSCFKCRRPVRGTLVMIYHICASTQLVLLAQHHLLFCSVVFYFCSLEQTLSLIKEPGHSFLASAFFRFSGLTLVWEHLRSFSSCFRIHPFFQIHRQPRCGPSLFPPCSLSVWRFIRLQLLRGQMPRPTATHRTPIISVSESSRKVLASKIIPLAI